MMKYFIFIILLIFSFSGVANEDDNVEKYKITWKETKGLHKQPGLRIGKLYKHWRCGINRQQYKNYKNKKYIEGEVYFKRKNNKNIGSTNIKLSNNSLIIIKNLKKSISTVNQYPKKPKEIELAYNYKSQSSHCVFINDKNSKKTCIKNAIKICKNAFEVNLVYLGKEGSQKKKKINTSTGISEGTQEDLIVNVGDRVFFNYDSSELDSDAQELLQDQAAWLNQYPNTRVIIEGHADERSTFNYGLAIANKRAISVKNYLITQGIDSKRISTVSYGNTRPAVVGSNDGAWAQNRRAVTIVD